MKKIVLICAATALLFLALLGYFNMCSCNKSSNSTQSTDQELWARVIDCLQHQRSLAFGKPPKCPGCPDSSSTLVYLDKNGEYLFIPKGGTLKQAGPPAYRIEQVIIKNDSLTRAELRVIVRKVE